MVTTNEYSTKYIAASIATDMRNAGVADGNFESVIVDFAEADRYLTDQVREMRIELLSRAAASLGLALQCVEETA